MKTIDKLISILLVMLMMTSVMYGCTNVDVIQKTSMPTFESGEDLIMAFKEANDPTFLEKVGGVFSGGARMMTTDMAVAESTSAGSVAPSSNDYSKTNVQVQGVDESDIIKTDGDYIYTITQGSLVIVDAYPASKAEILSTTKIDGFIPTELFIHNDRLLVFGYSSYEIERPVGKLVEERYYPRQIGTMSVKLYDISDKEEPELLRTVDFEGSYITSRKINNDVYFVVNSYPRYYGEDIVCEDILPKYRETSIAQFMPITSCTDVGYVKPIQATNFITVASISMTDENKEVEKEVIVGSGQNVYASEENLYIAQTTWPRYDRIVGEVLPDYSQKTVITKFELNNGKINFLGTGEVKGRILNQFSMDEYKGNFRIATTINRYANNKDESTNNMYVLDEDLDLIGNLEGIAPGEKIYSVRFMGKRGYMVTFRHVDPLFVIDLSDPTNPEVLGKLKIPGYSDYLHPYDENTDGLIEYGRAENERGAHVKWKNGGNLGVCVIGVKSQDYTSMQMNLLRKLVIYWMLRYGIPVDKVYGHKELSKNKPVCPDFDMNEFRASIAKELERCTKK